MTEEKSFATFWEGPPLSGIEKACLHSIAVREHPIFLYSYSRVADLPSNVVWRWAGEILEESYTKRFIYMGKPNLAPFSNFFRYNLFKKTPHTWIDADVLLLKNANTFSGQNVLVRENENSINNAVMRISENNSLLQELIEITENSVDRELAWGETGPKLITKLLRRNTYEGLSVYPSNTFYPIKHDDFWKPFHPDYRAECGKLCSEAYGVHLWNNIIDNMGFWKMIGPPIESFLYERLKEDGSTIYFDKFYPADVIVRLTNSWQIRKSGADLGAKMLARRLPSALKNAAVKLAHRMRC